MYENCKKYAKIGAYRSVVFYSGYKSVLIV